MSLSLSPEPSKGLLLTIRIIKVLLPDHVASHSPSLTLKIGGFTWQVSKSHDFSQSTYWNKSSTFELPDFLPMFLGISYKSGLFKTKEFCSTTVNSEIFSSKKGVRFTEIVNSNEKVNVLWGFYSEENRKGDEFLKLISEVEAEREQVKYLKNKVKAKLQRVKESSKSYKEQLKNLLSNFEGVFECS
jgi:hypothetical protein